MELSWEEKAAALQALVGWYNFGLKMRCPGNWYVQHSGLERKEGGCLSGGLQNGKTPQEAVVQCCDWATDDSHPEYYLVVDAMGPKRRAVRWNGFMWEDVEEDLKK